MVIINEIIEVENSFKELSKDILNDPVLFKKWFIRSYVSIFNHNPEITFDDINQIMIGKNTDALKLMEEIARISSLVLFGEDLSIHIFSKSRNGNFCQLRRITAYIMCKKLNYSVSYIGRLMSKDHATVIHHCKTVKNWLEVDRVFQQRFNQVLKELKNNQIIYC
jgi:chromosomal replication initiator protein